MAVGETIRGLLELTRPGNVIAASVLTFIGAFVAGGVLDNHLEVAAAVAATGLAVGGGNAINDYFDREIDQINQRASDSSRCGQSAWGTCVQFRSLWGCGCARGDATLGSDCDCGD